MIYRKWQIAMVLVTLLVFVSVAQAQNVKVTPVGARTGDFCATDRALIFEDPTGVRILYDPGRATTGGNDPRLGDIHVVLISHAHPDHIGDAKTNQDPDSPGAACVGAPLVTAPNSVTAEIAAAKNSALIAGSPLATFLGTKIAAQAATTNTAGCPSAGLTNEMTVPRTAPCTAGIGFGGKRTIRHVSATRGVQVAVVAAEHPNELSPNLVTDPQRTNFSSNALSAYVGVANGFVVTFTNGLKVYLSGDTGLIGDMSSVVNGYYGVNLAVLNVGDNFTIGAEEGAFAVLNMIKPAAVIPEHVNEAATTGGVLNPASRTALFANLVAAGAPKFGDIRDLFQQAKPVSVYLPLSGTTMEFNGAGQCVSGCR